MRVMLILAVCLGPWLAVLRGVEVAAPAQTPLTPFGLVGDEAIGEPLAGREFWAGLICTPGRGVSGGGPDLTPWCVSGGACGPLSSGDGWNFGYEAGASWRVHQQGSFDSGDDWLTQAILAGLGEWVFSPDWVAVGRLGAVFSDGSQGAVIATAEVEGGVAYALAEGGNLVMGISYRGLTADAFSESALLPMVEWHLPASDRWDLVLGFPRSAARWFPAPGSEVGLRWRFLADAELGVRQRVGDRTGLAFALWHRSQAWAGTEDGRFYVEEAGASFVVERIGERTLLQAGPLMIFDETWRSGADRDRARTVARIKTGWGFLAGGGLVF